MYERSQVLARNLASVTGERKKRRARALKTDRTLQLLVADLVAARTAAGMTQEAVAARMWTTKSVVSRLESGVCTRPTLSTIEKYAVAVGALVKIRVRIRQERNVDRRVVGSASATDRTQTPKLSLL
jgi:ribosome-binding protein aMBF1 (putative translation factor)